MEDDESTECDRPRRCGMVDVGNGFKIFGRPNPEDWCAVAAILAAAKSARKRVGAVEMVVVRGKGGWRPPHHFVTVTLS
jgi:hypothetical protein